MSRLPILSGRQLVKALAKLDYVFDRQRGSHIVLRHAAPPHRRLVVPDHDEIAKGTLRSILREAGLSIDQYVDCFDTGLSYAMAIHVAPRRRNAGRIYLITSRT